MGTPTVVEMVEAALKAGGYDGLYEEDGECACELADLAPCEGVMGGMMGTCTAGWKVPCDCGEHDWHISSVKP